LHTLLRQIDKVREENIHINKELKNKLLSIKENRMKKVNRNTAVLSKTVAIIRHKNK